MNGRSMMRHFAAATLLSCTAAVAAQTGSLRAGAAKVDITPTQDMFPLTSGQTYGSVHDPLFAHPARLADDQ